MITIKEYPLANLIEMPANAQPLALRTSFEGHMMMIVSITGDYPIVPHSFHIIQTNQSIENIGAYVGTVNNEAHIPHHVFKAIIE